jgi:hypothetical protein
LDLISLMGLAISLGPSNACFHDCADNRKCVWASQDNGRVEPCTIQSYLCSGAHPRYDLKSMSIFVSKIPKTEFRAWNPIDDILRLYQIKTNLDIPTMASDIVPVSFTRTRFVIISLHMAFPIGHTDLCRILRVVIRSCLCYSDHFESATCSVIGQISSRVVVPFKFHGRWPILLRIGNAA